jgi:hypothetical protein
MQEVLIDGDQFIAEGFVEVFYDGGICFHENVLLREISA